MPISFDQTTRTFKLDTATSTYMIRVYDQNYILNLYYGAKIPDVTVPDREMISPNASFSAADPGTGSMRASRRSPASPPPMRRTTATPTRWSCTPRTRSRG